MGEVRTRLVGFALVLGGVFASAYTLGERLPGHRHSHSHTVDTRAYQLSPEPDGTYTLRGVNGRALTSFQLDHQARIHLIAVRPDLSRMVHEHPTPAADGSFTVPLPDAGPWRVFAEALPSGSPTVVVGRTDVGLDRPFTRVPLPPAHPTATITAGGDSITVTRHGLQFAVDAPRPIEPYLGQPAHLILIGAADDSYHHLHPTSSGHGHLSFDPAGLPAGTYAAFLQFTYAGSVVTVPMTVDWA